MDFRDYVKIVMNYGRDGREVIMGAVNGRIYEIVWRMKESFVVLNRSSKDIMRVFMYYGIVISRMNARLLYSPYII